MGQKDSVLMYEEFIEINMEMIRAIEKNAKGMHRKYSKLYIFILRYILSYMCRYIYIHIYPTNIWENVRTHK